MQKIHRKFKQLSSNRTDHVLAQRKQRQADRVHLANTEQANLSYQPQISSRSHKIFDKMVKKGKVEVGQGQSYEDYLMNQGKLYESRRQEAQAKKDMEDKEAQECTFQPTVYVRPGGPASARHNYNSGSKWE